MTSELLEEYKRLPASFMVYKKRTNNCYLITEFDRLVGRWLLRRIYRIGHLHNALILILASGGEFLMNACLVDKRYFKARLYASRQQT